MPQESRLHANHDIGHLIITQTVSCHLDLDYGVSIYIYAHITGNTMKSSTVGFK